MLEFLKSNGWVPMPNMPDFMVESSGDRCIDLTGDYGFAWELLRISEGTLFTTGKGVEGDTLEELKEALNAAAAR
jgi:hypothetical protein